MQLLNMKGLSIPKSNKILSHALKNMVCVSLNNSQKLKMEMINRKKNLSEKE
jgi:hypothetical protein